MEIRIRTAEEFRDSHVTIEIVAREVEETSDVALPLNSDAEIRELEERVRSFRTANEELVATVDRLVGRTIQLEADLESQREIFRGVRQDHQRLIENRNGELEKQRRIIEQALAVMSTTEVVQAQRMCMGDLEQRMARAICEARRILLGEA